MEWLVEAEHLYRQFDDLVAVNDINLRVAAGEIYGLVGPDGAGKTTTLRLLCGAYQPTPSGDYPAWINICGFDMLKQSELARTHIGYLSQRFSLYEDLTVLENIRFFSELRGLSASQWQSRCMEILEFVGLDEFKDRRAGQLSGGMKQKLGLASALVTRPHVMLLDEPTTGVDPVTRQDFWHLVTRLVSSSENDDGICVLISTPYMDEAARCQRIGFMRKGKMIREGTPSQLRQSLNQQVLELRGPSLTVLRQVAQDDRQVTDVRAFGDRLHILLQEADTPAVLARLRAAVSQDKSQLLEARTIAPTLEDVFIALSNQEE